MYRYKSPKQLYYDLREAVAKAKDSLTADLLKPKPKYLGDAIPIRGIGILAHYD